MDRKQTLIDVHRPYYFFHWRHLMSHMKALALEAGAKFLFESEVLDLIEEGKCCTGIKYKQWSVYKYIKKSYRDIVLAEKIMFKFCGFDTLLNRWWKPLMALLQMKS